MTTVTEAAKRLGLDPHSLEKADLAALKADPALAQQFARRLASIAKDLMPQLGPAEGWSLEDLRDVMEVAIQGARVEGSRIVEGRYLRKRVREQCAYADRYGESFALVVVMLVPEPSPGFYARSAEQVVEKLRRSDMITVYRRRIAMLLPRMRREALDPLLARVRARVDQDARRPVVESVEHLVYPADQQADTQSVLDWLEDQLRVDP